MSKIYLTTAIPYVNGTPHIGHAMDYLLSDVYFRYRKMSGDDVRLQAGTDEHGNKVFSKAQALGIPVKSYVDVNSQKFQDFIAKLGVQPTDFVRTTDPDHEHRCQEIWQKLSDHIYPASYEGWYCEGCEGFVTEKEYAENNGVCPDHQKPYQHLSETNYYLRISDFKDQIRSAITSGTMQILPEFRAKEVLNLLEDSPDVSISRPRKNLNWGIPVPNDDSQVMYVWIDALANYITVLGYPDTDISDWWPASVQFVGKDILRFHAIIWPAMLLGLGLPLPKVLHSHGHILADGQKMSKSLGNVVDPIEVIDTRGRDAFRYYFLHHVDTFSDSDFTWEKFNAAYNNELANDLGNLVQRLTTLISKNNISYIPKTNNFSQAYVEAMDKLNFNLAIEHAWSHLQDLNKFINETKPWELAKKGDIEQLTHVLTTCADNLLHANYELTPFLPDVTAKISSIFASDHITPPTAPLFPKN